MEVRLYTWFDMSFIPNGNEELVSIDCWYHTPHTLYNITSLVSRRRCYKIGNLRSSNIDVTHPSNLDL